MKTFRSSKLDWDAVGMKLKEIARTSKKSGWLNHGQLRSLQLLASRLPDNGVIIADEVGMGKTRLSVAVAKAVTEAGGRVAILIPPGLGYQWQTEFQEGGINITDPLKSLQGFFEPWKNEQSQNWGDQQIILVSHHFSNWRHTENQVRWRTQLLPAVYAYARKQLEGRLPRNFNNGQDYCYWVKECAEQIVDAIPPGKAHPARLRLESIRQFDWTKQSSVTGVHGDKEAQVLLRKAVGLGLGPFDLVIIDEAHKRRGADSGLSKLLNDILCKTSNHRVLALTATPIELEIQDWKDLFQRICIPEEIIVSAEAALKQYSDAANDLRKLWNNPAYQQRFSKASNTVHALLKPYLVRRRKTDEAIIKRLTAQTGSGIYRKEQEVLVMPEHSSMKWRKAVCAAESLSWLSDDAENRAEKRMRQTFANMHGLIAMFSKEARNGSVDNALKRKANCNAANEKKTNRKQFWLKRLKAVAGDINNHPALIQTVECIEEYTKKGEKVLVFGTYIQPLKVLTALLNARELVRAIERKDPWPQGQLNKDEEKWVGEAIKQTKSRLSIQQIQKQLKQTSAVTAKQKRTFRGVFRDWLIIDYLNGTVSSKFKNLGRSALTDKVFFESISSGIYEYIYGHRDHSFGAYHAHSHAAIEEAFESIIKAAAHQDHFDDDKGAEKEGYNIDQRRIKSEIIKEFGGKTPRYAKLMFGNSSPESRRMMQLAFNRETSPLQVLVAQSMVGREGLNLHLACKTVILFHAEWNPATVEQQIGRVDRVGSLWEKETLQFLEGKRAKPYISFRPVIFKHTYDEQHWAVLKRRWNELKAQLHGIVVSEDIFERANDTDRDEIRKVNQMAPDFSP